MDTHEKHQSRLREAVALDAACALQELLEKKHLFQSVTVEFERAAAVAESTPPLLGKISAPPLYRGVYDPPLEERKKRAVSASNGTIQRIASGEWFFQIEGVNPVTSSERHFFAPTIRVACDFCDGVLPPHNPGYRGCREHPWTFAPQAAGKEYTQLFALPYQCQNCKGEPIVYFVRRQGLKLQITGRSRFETVPVPKQIPKQEQRHYRDALISYNSGRPLAALFFLRTFIEQYMRRVTQSDDPQMRGDDLTERYHKLLDKSFPPQFRTFRELYGDLSDRLHRAVEDEQCFLEALGKIESHFEMLRMIPLAKPKRSEEPDASQMISR